MSYKSCVQHLNCLKILLLEFRPKRNIIISLPSRTGFLTLKHIFFSYRTFAYLTEYEAPQIRINEVDYGYSLMKRHVLMIDAKSFLIFLFAFFFLQKTHSFVLVGFVVAGNSILVCIQTIRWFRQRLNWQSMIIWLPLFPCAHQFIPFANRICRTKPTTNQCHSILTFSHLSNCDNFLISWLIPEIWGDNFVLLLIDNPPLPFQGGQRPKKKAKHCHDKISNCEVSTWIMDLHFVNTFSVTQKKKQTQNRCNQCHKSVLCK